MYRGSGPSAKIPGSAPDR